MARTQGRTGSPTNLYLDDEVKAQAAKLAFSENKSLSSMIEELLRKKIRSSEKRAELRRAA